MAIFVASNELHPCAMLANGPPCTKAAVFSVVCTKLGCNASLSSTVMAPATPKSFTVKGLLSYVKPKMMFSMRRRRSCTSFDKQRIAMISDAGVMSKPDSWVMPLLLGPKPTTMLRSERSFTSSTLRHKISFSPKPFDWFWYR